MQSFPIAGIIASKRSAAKAADKVSPSVNYVHVKRIASIPCGHTSYLPGPLAVAITLELLDIPARIATIVYLDHSLILSLSSPSHLLSPISIFSVCIFHSVFLFPRFPLSSHRFRNVVSD